MIRIIFILSLSFSLQVYAGDLPKPFETEDFCRLSECPIPKKAPVRNLSTLLNFLKNPKTLSAKFSVFNRRQKVLNIPFLPDDSYCVEDPAISWRRTFDNRTNYHDDLERLGREGESRKLRTIVIIPGFLTGEREIWMETAKDLWLRLEDVNVVLVTWKDGNSIPYSRAAANTPIVARQIAIFLHYLADRFNLKLNEKFTNNIHIFGHSLGSHIAGFVGKDLQDFKLGRITALDPAGPSFDKLGRADRLDKTDARLVEAIHTNAGTIHYLNTVASGIVKGFVAGVNYIPFVGEKLVSSLELKNYTGEGDTAWFGLDEDVGHVDYYAHNGKVQPGCNDLMHICDHCRANEIFVNLLRYELMLRERMNLQQESPSRAREILKQHRILAFKSSDYDSFKNGENLSKHCPKLLDLKFALKSTDEIINTCSIPLDLTARVDELLHEYSVEYRIDFANLDSKTPSENRFYFETLTTNEKLVGDHYLLKVGIIPDQSVWNEDCALKLELIMSDGSKHLIDVNKDSLSPTTLFGFYNGLATLFINNHTVSAREDLNNLLELPEDGNSDPLNRGRFQEMVEKIMPLQVDVRIQTAQSTGYFEALKNKLLIWDTKRGKKKCKLAIDLVEVQPLINNPRDVIGIYCLQGTCNKEQKLFTYRTQTDEIDKYLENVKAASKRGTNLITGSGPQTSVNYQINSVIIGH